jgi:hypothetical protein
LKHEGQNKTVKNTKTGRSSQEQLPALSENKETGRKGKSRKKKINKRLIQEA